MMRKAFADHRAAALALLSECPDLPRKTAGMLGHICATVTPSRRQLLTLTALLEQSGLPPLAM